MSEITKLPCPHCELPVAVPQSVWFPPFTCSHCAGLFGVGEVGLFKISSSLKPPYPLMAWENAKYWSYWEARRPYVYAICYPNGLPFYVGKGRAQRLLQHSLFLRADLKRKGEPRNEKERVIAAIHSAGFEERYAILATCETDKQAYQFEAKTIKEMGRRECGGLLTNEDDGYCSENVEQWCLPAQEAIKANGVIEESKWVIHPDLSGNIRSHKGILVRCPRCQAFNYHPANTVLDGGRCHKCYHFMGIDGEFLHNFWRSHRPKLNEVKRLDINVADYAIPPEPKLQPTPIQQPSGRKGVWRSWMQMLR